MKKRQMLHVLLAAVFLLQMLPLGFAQALLPDDPSRTVPGNITEAVEVNQSASYVAIKDSTGNPLSPDGNGDFTNVPLDSTLTLHYEFSLPDDNGQDDPNAKEYSYLSGDTYQIQLPNSVLFDLPSESTPLWADASKTTCLGTLTLDSNGLATITFNDYVESHSTITGWFEINGSFKSSVTGSDTPVSFEIGSKTIRIIPQTPPAPTVDLGLSKSGAYDASTNQITWIVTVTVPDGQSVTGVSLEDVYSGNQAYVPNSFTVNNGSLLDSSADLTLDSTNCKITYQFPDTISGKQTIIYKTTPVSNAFSAENGVQENSQFKNTATLKVNNVTNGDPKSDTVILDWISKSASTSSDLSSINWAVTAGIKNQSIKGAKITDTFPAGLALQPGSVKLGGPTGAVVPEDTANPANPASGTYGYDAATRTLIYNAGDVTGQFVLYYSTDITDRDAHLNNNGSVSFKNGAELSWTGGSGTPGDTATGTIGSGGLISKSTGSQVNYDATKNIIHWTITVNRNQITMPAGTIVTDTIPAGQKFLADTFAVKNSAGQTISTTPTTSSDNEFTYSFVSEIQDKYTMTFDTQITDYGLSSLYVNDTVGFQNSATIKGGSVSGSTGDIAQKYNSQVIDKSVQTAYNYDTRVMTWKIVVNRNQLPMTNAVVTDSIPAGMELLPDTLTVTPAIAGEASDAREVHISEANDITNQDSFTYRFPSSINQTYTITFDTKVKEAALLAQGQKTFTNQAALTSDEIQPGITVTASQDVQNPIVTKTADYIQGADSIDWSVVINAGRLTLRNVSLSDTLQGGLQLDLDSVQLYKMNL
ncbi:MAG: collagen binding domain-containing protein, partial [Oscillospiraceae bacterium]|nr:collagen binding domain-containing protein [Oscillospiraceae bacterium]